MNVYSLGYSEDILQRGYVSAGVLLLNACLTVRQQQANSHQGKGWEKVTDAVIRWLNNKMKNVVFILWGSYAQKKGAFIDKVEKKLGDMYI